MSERPASAAAATSVLFIVGVVALGDVLGSFADPDEAFVDLFSSGGRRAVFIVGSLALTGAAVSLVSSVIGLTGERPGERVPVLVSAGFAAGSMVLAGLAFLTVPLSLSLGSLTDDPGFESAQGVLPQFGTVALVIGAMLPAAVLVLLLARTPGLLPRWLRTAGYVLQLAAFAVMPILLFGLWLGAVSVVLRRSPALDDPT